QQGAVYVFTLSGTTWTEQQKLVASDAANGDYFGFSVAISGGTAVIGALFKNGHGEAYIFTRSGMIWAEQSKLLPGNGEGDFGASVAIDLPIAVLGIPFDTFGGANPRGSARVYTLP
ncbi:MAG: hypothetical protein H7X77_05715, partial [Anaerolineae bacterium]|nr:hypothetical protein [Anaerolineae bacterium]